MAKLGGFARSGQGLGSRSKKAGVAAGGRPNSDDQKNSVQFTSGNLGKGKPKANKTMNQAPAKTKNSRKGVNGTDLNLGNASPTQAVQPSGKLKNTKRGVSSTLPLGQGRGDSSVTSSSNLKNAK